MSVAALAESRGLEPERGWHEGLGPYTATTIDLPSGRPCVLDELDHLRASVRAPVRVLAEPADDQDDVLEAVLSFFALPRSVVVWTAVRPFREFGPAVCILDATVEDLASGLGLQLERGQDAGGGTYALARLHVEERQVLLVGSRRAGLPEVEVLCSWYDDPGELLAPVLHALGADARLVVWTP